MVKYPVFGNLPIGVFTPFTVTIFGIDCTVIAFEYIPEPTLVQPLKVWKPVTIGLFPEPNELMQIGKLNVPDLFTVIVPVYVSPDLKRTESPGKRLLENELSLAIVFQGVAGFCA